MILAGWPLPVPIDHEQSAENDAPKPSSEDAGVDMLTAYYRRGRRDAAEQIARAIDWHQTRVAEARGPSSDGAVAYAYAARIARECRVIPPASTAPERDRAAEVEAAEDRAEQAAFDAMREAR